MDYMFFTEKEREYLIDCWELFVNEGKDDTDTNYRKTIPAFNVDFYKNEFKPNFINIDSYIGDIDDKYYSDSSDLKNNINYFLSLLNYKDEILRIARECFEFDECWFEEFSIDVIDLIDYKFKSNQIKNLEDAYNCYKEYNEFLGYDDDLDEYKEKVENKIKELMFNSHYECSIEHMEDVLLRLTTSRYMYFSITKMKTMFNKMNLKHFDPIEALYIYDIYHEYQNYIRKENARYESEYYYGNDFLEYFNKENPHLENNIEEKLANKTFKVSKCEEYYNKIVEIFELEKVFKDDEEKKNYFNLLEFKFKVYDKEALGVLSLEQAYEICKDLCLILEKEKAIKVFESCYLFNTNSQNTLSNKEDKYDYDVLTPILDKYFDNGSREVYKSIIEYHCLDSPSTKKLKANPKVSASCLKSFFDVPIKVLNKVFEFDKPLKSGNFPREGEHPAIYIELEKIFPKVK